MIYTYDGTFEGLLTAIYEAYYRRECPDRILKDSTIQQNMFDSYSHISSDEEKAEKVYDSIRKKISTQALRHSYYTFLTEFEEAGTWIYRYLKFGWEVGYKIDYHLTDDRVHPVHTASRKVEGEKHLLLGLLRFKKLSDNLFYASLEPDYNIVSIIAPHFAERMADQNWIIHDLRRNICALYNRQEWVTTELDSLAGFSFDEEELKYQGLWKRYFDNIAIQSRINPKLQKQHLPRRYWKHLIEKQLF